MLLEHGHERRGDVAHEFGRAVRTGLEDGTDIKAETGELERQVLGAKNIEERDKTAEALTDARRQRRACQPPMEYRDEQRIEHHVGLRPLR